MANGGGRKMRLTMAEEENDNNTGLQIRGEY